MVSSDTHPISPAPDRPRRRGRRCVVDRESAPRGELLRFVITPDGALVSDLDERLPGRGFWVRANRDRLQRAVDKKAFQRAARRSVTVPADLADQVYGQVERRCLNLIGLARRAGALVTGFDAVSRALKARRPGIVIAARDGGAANRAKLAGLAQGYPLLVLADAAELGRAVGQTGVMVNGFIARGRLATRLQREAQRLAALSPTRNDTDRPVTAAAKVE